MADDPTDSMLAQYGDGYADPRLGMSGGDRIDYGTQDVLERMYAQQSAQDRAPYEALARLFMTALAPAAGAHRAVSNSLLPKAIGYHNRLEQKMGNELVNTWTKPALSAFLAMTTPAMARVLAREQPSFGERLPAMVGRIKDGPGNIKTELLAPHLEDTAHIFNQLKQMNSRAPKYRSLY